MRYEVSGRQADGYADSASGNFGFGEAIARLWKSLTRPAPLGVSLSSQTKGKTFGPLLSVQNPARLSRNELRVCLLLSQLLSVDVVEKELGLTREAIRLHLRNIFQKTGCQSLAELTHKLLEPASRVTDNLQARRLLSSAPKLTDWEIAQRLRV